MTRTNLHVFLHRLVFYNFFRGRRTFQRDHAVCAPRFPHTDLVYSALLCYLCPEWHQWCLWQREEFVQRPVWSIGGSWTDQSPPCLPFHGDFCRYQSLCQSCSVPNWGPRQSSPTAASWLDFWASASVGMRRQRFHSRGPERQKDDRADYSAGEGKVLRTSTAIQRDAGFVCNAFSNTVRQLGKTSRHLRGKERAIQCQNTHPCGGKISRVSLYSHLHISQMSAFTLMAISKATSLQRHDKPRWQDDVSQGI